MAGLGILADIDLNPVPSPSRFYSLSRFGFFFTSSKQYLLSNFVANSDKYTSHFSN